MCKKISETEQDEMKTLRVAGISYKEHAPIFPLRKALL